MGIRPPSDRSPQTSVCPLFSSPAPGKPLAGNLSPANTNTKKASSCTDKTVSSFLNPQIMLSLRFNAVRDLRRPHAEGSDSDFSPRYAVQVLYGSQRRRTSFVSLNTAPVTKVGGGFRMRMPIELYLLVGAACLLLCRYMHVKCKQVMSACVTPKVWC